MRRALGWLVLVLLVGGPALQLRCAAACAAAARPDAESACHHENAGVGAASFAAVARHDCPPHAGPDGVTAPSLFLANAVHATGVIAAADAAARRAANVPTPPVGSGGPPGSFRIPQRI